MIKRKTIILLIGTALLNFALVSTALLLHYRKKCHVQQSSEGTAGRYRIIGGERAPIEDFSYVASVVVIKHETQPTDKLKCSACIISNFWLVSAAHCLTILEQVRILEFILQQKLSL
ncbi:hypothetical protein ILUMI_11911 [Ignelater luminosus]|uniref:Peptidase S1 domain-containing protein n=1 Tax=Ignelater luminosus TaxID=2038154 RepID=A0A8K0D1B5_IGNLU|nr:hypothetical protein ILUMI_11911 [Ignelater luminosus]